MKKIVLFFMAFVLIGLSGCAQKNDYFKSQEKFVVDQGRGGVIVNDFIALVRDYYNPATTKFVVDAEDTKSYFYISVESRLRELGYGVGNVGDSSSTWLAWKIDRLDNGLLIVNYLVGDSKYTRAYSEVHGEYSPLSQFTVFNKKDKITYPKSLKHPLITSTKDENKTYSKNSEQTDIFSAFLRSDGYLKRTKASGGERDGN